MRAGKVTFSPWLLSQGTFSHLNAHPVRDERGAVAWPGREAEAQLGVVSELGRSVSDEALHLHEHRATLVRLLEPQDVALTAPGKLNLYRTAGEGRVDFHCRRPLSTGGSGAVAHVRDTSIESSIRVCEGAGVFRHHVQSWSARVSSAARRTRNANVSVTRRTRSSLQKNLSKWNVPLRVNAHISSISYFLGFVTPESVYFPRSKDISKASNRRFFTDGRRGGRGPGVPILLRRGRRAARGAVRVQRKLSLRASQLSAEMAIAADALRRFHREKPRGRT